jgi:Uma2 family endonuclease
MIASPQQDYLTAEAYLEMEENSDVKHEYIDGYIYAMAGAFDPHVTIAGNLFALLRNHVRGSGCRVYISDMKARIESLNRFYYPPAYKKYPCLIVEVLSDSTEAFDRGDKFADYQVLESLQEYVLINTKRQRVECFQRNNEGLWVLRSYTSQQEFFRLNSINFEGTMAALYEDVIFEA